MEIRLEGVTKRRGGFELGPLDLLVPSGQYLVLSGPNGAGKTTLLYLIAGFLPPDAGVVRFDGADVTSEPPERRAAAFVFTEPMLFSHLTAAQNVGFSRKHGRLPAEEVQAALDILGVGSLAAARASELSTGQARRVEIARALASKPRVLLLDEPYAAIDAADRPGIAGAVKALAAERQMTVLHVSHHDEDLALGDAVLRLRRGRIDSETPITSSAVDSSRAVGDRPSPRTPREQ